MFKVIPYFILVALLAFYEIRTLKKNKQYRDIAVISVLSVLTVIYISVYLLYPDAPTISNIILTLRGK